MGKTNTPKLFVTGDSGFVGSSLKRLAATGTLFDAWDIVTASESYDLSDEEETHRIINKLNPDAVLHLGGLTNVPDAIKNPRRALDVNLVGTLNLLRSLKASGFNGSFLYVSSGDVYGHVSPDSLPITETLQVKPSNPYAVSKAAAELLCYQWSCVEPWRIMIARPFNHIGPGQMNAFVIPSVAQQIVKIKAGKQEPVIQVGDISVSRDFLDVQDVLAAYQSLLEQGESGQTYNVCSGRERIVGELISDMIRLANMDIKIIRDPERLRPSDQPRVKGSYQKLHEVSGWEPKIRMEQTLQSILLDWEKREK